MSGTGLLDPRYLDNLRSVAHDLGYHLVKRSECLEIGASAMLSNEVMMTLKDDDKLHYLMSTLARKIAHEIAQNVKPKLLPRISDAEVYELRLTLLKPLEAIGSKTDG